MCKAKVWIALLLICCMTVLPACSQTVVTEKKDSLIAPELIVPEKPKYTTKTVIADTLSSFLSEKAYMRASELELSWSDANSYYQKVWVTKGQAVKKGDWLITFSKQRSQAETDALKLELDQLQRDVAEEKQRQQYAIEDATTAAVDLSGREKTIAQLEIKKLQISYEQYTYEKDLEIKELKDRLAAAEGTGELYGLQAPFDGTISYIIAAQIGAKAKTATKLVTVRSSEEPQLWANYQTGLRYNLELVLDVAGKAYDAKIVSSPNILPASASSNQVIIAMETKIEMNPSTFRSTYMIYHERLHEVPVVDGTFVFSDEGGNFVRILKNDEVHKRYVILGPSNRKAYWILEGVSVGDVLVKTKG